MIKIVDMCCDCAVPGYPCLGSSCPRRNVEVHCCDICGEQFGDTVPSDIYDVDGEEICEECLKEKFIRK